ncbi:Alpha/Beta hydrolase protein, partial [Crassisporium funariophilum]
MPFVRIETSSGPFDFRYFIATPTSCTGTQIDERLPSVIFLHSGYVAQEVFECQFSDPDLRQFNLIGIDMRTYGDTQGFIGETRFTPTESAADVEQVMTMLNLPPCHIFGLSNGCTVALELAVAHPERVLSLTLCSPLSETEIEDIANGRIEMYRYWKWIDRTDEMIAEEQGPAPDINVEVMIGANQLLYNHMKTRFVLAIGEFALAIARRNWAGSPEKAHDSYKSNVEWFLERRAIPLSLLAKIRGPVSIIHCSEDVAYPADCAEALLKQLKKAGVPVVSLHEVSGAHYGNATHPQGINRILYDTVLSHPASKFVPERPETRASEQKKNKKMKTPYTESLGPFGYDISDSDDSD